MKFYIKVYYSFYEKRRFLRKPINVFELVEIGIKCHHDEYYAIAKDHNFSKSRRSVGQSWMLTHKDRKPTKKIKKEIIEFVKKNAFGHHQAFCLYGGFDADKDFALFDILFDVKKSGLQIIYKDIKDDLLEMLNQMSDEDFGPLSNFTFHKFKEDENLRYSLADKKEMIESHPFFPASKHRSALESAQWLYELAHAEFLTDI